jgi:hypothetical protein
MAFSYNFGANPRVDYPRLLIGDTAETPHVFEDAEIEAAYAIQSSVFQSGPRYSGAMGGNVPTLPVSYLRVAAMLLDCIAGNRARQGAVSQVFDIRIEPGQVDAALRAQAKQWREIDDDSGAIAIIEQCHTEAGWLQRMLSEAQRTL